MKQVVQDIRSGSTDIREIPAPIAQPGAVVVATAASLISAGTERYVVDLAKKSLLGKARSRPDQVKRVLIVVNDQHPLLVSGLGPFDGILQISSLERPPEHNRGAGFQSSPIAIVP